MKPSPSQKLPARRAATSTRAVRRVVAASTRKPVKKAVLATRPTMPANLPPSIKSQLRGLSSRVVRVAWVSCLLRIVFAACGLCLLQCTADLLLDLPRRTRAVFLLGDAALLVFLVGRYAVRPWRQRLSPDEAALLAQKHWPELRSTLISTVQLAREPNGAPWMVANLQKQVAKHLGRLNLRQAVRWSRLRKLFLAALTLAALTAFLAWRTAPVSTILGKRALLANLPLPTRTVVVDISQNLSIPPGESVELSARAQGETPRSGRVDVTYEGKVTQSVAVVPQVANPGVFSLKLPNVQQPLTYRFYLGDGRGPEWQVSLVHAPVLQSVQFHAVYPAYSGLSEANVAAGNLRLLAGTRLQITGRADQPLQSARLVPQTEGQPVELKTSGDRRDFKGELTIPAKGLTAFSIPLRSDGGVQSHNDTSYAVEIVPDLPPQITVAPDQPEKATLIATAKPGLQFEVSDDFQVQKVFLCVQPADTLGEGESPDPAKAKRVSIDIKKPADRLVFDFHWNDPEKVVKWQEGNTFYYWIEAVDNNNVTGPGTTYTPVREWSVVSLKTKRDELTDTLRKSADSIENLSQNQEELRRQVGNLLRQDPPKTP